MENKAIILTSRESSYFLKNRVRENFANHGYFIREKDGMYYCMERRGASSIEHASFNNCNALFIHMRIKHKM